MNKYFKYFTILTFLISISCKSEQPIEPPIAKEPPPPVVKTNDMKLYMHYMPWFQSKEFSGIWGSHWRMANKNPEYIDGNGKRQIASHYYPLIGPYDSSDPDVIEYHLLLLKYAGVDGILIDWYGSFNIVDYGTNLKASNALIQKLEEVGLEFSIVYEEYTAENVMKRKGITAIEAAQADMTYMTDNYFGSGQYIRIDNEPLLLTFGPRYFKDKNQWTEIFEVANEPINFLPLWNHDHFVGSNASGEFSWVDFDYSLSSLSSFYDSNIKNKTLIGSAYPGFRDYYKEGGWGESYGNLSYFDGNTLQSTLDKAAEYNLSYLQLVTWNDFGEGTMFEPTDEFQFQFIERLQQFAGVNYSIDEFNLIHDYYLKKKEHADDAEKEAVLEKIYNHLSHLEVMEAKELLNTI